MGKLNATPLKLIDFLDGEGVQFRVVCSLWAFVHLSVTPRE